LPLVALRGLQDKAGDDALRRLSDENKVPAVSHRLTESCCARHTASLPPLP
jgi:hypothetical protein